MYTFSVSFNKNSVKSLSKFFKVKKIILNLIFFLFYSHLAKPITSILNEMYFWAQIVSEQSRNMPEGQPDISWKFFLPSDDIPRGWALSKENLFSKPFEHKAFPFSVARYVSQINISNHILYLYLYLTIYHRSIHVYILYMHVRISISMPISLSINS